MNISLVQFCATSSVEDNLAKVETLLAPFKEGGARQVDVAEINQSSNSDHVIVLPENFAVLDPANFLNFASNSSLVKHVLDWLCKLARACQCWLVGGTVPVLSATGEKVHTRSYLVSPRGEQFYHYDKMHLFDADVNDSVKSYRESDFIVPGLAPGCVDLPWSRVGIAICYDLRFPEYFRKLAKAGVRCLFVPAAFTYHTGQAHWLALLRARAIENQVYVAACNQGGKHDDGRETWGHSVIIDPWGKVLVEAGLGAKVLSAVIDLAYVDDVRKKMPVLQHIRL